MKSKSALKSDKKKENPQDILVNSLEGIFLVDAGAGTGKTHTIIRRYNKLVESDVKPEDILLITFTNVAANQMKEDVISKVNSPDITLTELLEAPVMTFHALCTRILKKSGGDAPRYMGIRETLSPNFSVMEDSIFERELFRRYYIMFRNRFGKKYAGVFRALDDDHHSALEIIKKLCSAGIFPSDKGWIENGKRRLEGDLEKFKDIVKDLNRVKKDVQSDAYKIINNQRGKIPVGLNIEEYIDRKLINEDKLEDIFEDPGRNELFEFVREIYLNYVIYLIKRNQLNFEFIVMLAYLKLVNDDKFREGMQYSHVMVDEFQDTDQIQFKLLMLLCRNERGKANLMVVGDWRQGIYGFRNTTIENITEFFRYIREHKSSINEKSEKIVYMTSESDITKIAFEYNYRSSQDILDFSRNALFVKATKSEVNEFNYESINFVNPLTARRKIGKLTEIGFLQTSVKDDDAETKLVLEKIREIVSDPSHKILEFDKDGNVSNERRVRYSDIAVLSRTRAFCIKLQKDAAGTEIPVAYDGGLEVFASAQGILVIAWLKLLLNPENRSALTTILEYEAYDFGQILYQTSQETIELPKEIASFRNELIHGKNNILYLLETINKRYGFRDEIAGAITSIVNKWNNSELVSIGEITELLENYILQDFEMEVNKSYDAVTSRTIHTSKGLEYPVVILSNVNEKIFPDNKNITGRITFNDVAGLRIKYMFAEVNGFYGNFDNWRTLFVNKACRRPDYSESRRLLYVALTRAKQYLFITANNPSQFFSVLAENTGKDVVRNFSFGKRADYAYSDEKAETEVPYPTEVSESVESVSVKRFVSTLHEMEDDTNSLGHSIKGLEYGRAIHLAAFKHAMGVSHKSISKGEDRIKKFIDELKANTLEAEIDFSLPKDGILIRGTIDLLAIYDDRITVVDYKTDRDKSRHDSYVGQVRIYMEAVRQLYKGKQVDGLIYYAGLDEAVKVDQ